MRKNISVSCLIVALGYLFFISVSPKMQPETEPVAAETMTEIVKVEPKQEIKEPSDYEVLVREVNKYDWDTKLMLAISKAESGHRKDAIGDRTLTYQKNGRIYGYSVGMFQIRILEGREQCDTFDIPTNVNCAYRIYKGQGLRAWSVYTNGAYKKFL